MYLNNDKFQEAHKCEDCKNLSICKWCEDMRMKQEEVSKIPVCKGLTPISINVTCESFQRKVTKQDGFDFAKAFYNK